MPMTATPSARGLAGRGRGQPRRTAGRSGMLLLRSSLKEYRLQLLQICTDNTALCPQLPSLTESLAAVASSTDLAPVCARAMFDPGQGKANPAPQHTGPAAAAVLNPLLQRCYRPRRGKWKGSPPIPWQGCLRHRCSVSLLKKAHAHTLSQTDTNRQDPPILPAAPRYTRHVTRRIHRPFVHQVQ